MMEAWENLRAVADAVTPCYPYARRNLRCGSCIGCRDHAALVAAIKRAEDAADTAVSDAAFWTTKELGEL